MDLKELNIQELESRFEMSAVAEKACIEIGDIIIL